MEVEATAGPRTETAADSREASLADALEPAEVEVVRSDRREGRSDPVTPDLGYAGSGGRGADGVGTSRGSLHRRAPTSVDVASAPNLPPPGPSPPTGADVGAASGPTHQLMI
uniref:DUF834 domain-containing protein n=1 Tax=Oryza punctata TaxID=4537 RepID=A0A0E0JKR1_ORYPU